VTRSPDRPSNLICKTPQASAHALLRVLMSGFEIAGVVLAVLPLVIDGLDACQDLAVFRLLSARSQRRKFVAQLMFVQTILRNRFERLLHTLEVELEPGHWDALKSSSVKGSQFFDVWNQVLQAYPELKDTTIGSEIMFVVEDLQTLLYDVIEHTAIPHDANAEVLIAIIQNHKHDPSFSMTTGLFKRFMFTWRDHGRRELIERMERNLLWIRELCEEHELMKSLIPTSLAKRDVTSNGAFLRTLREHFCCLHSALSGIWKCNCHSSPSAMLKLERRDAKQDCEVCFSLFLTFEQRTSEGVGEWEFRETKISVDPRYLALSNPC
jgi:hypothetical protein